MPGKPTNISTIAIPSSTPGVPSSCSPRETATLIEPLAAADQHAGLRGLDRGQLERAGHAIGREQRLATAERDRFDHQHELVDEIGGQQRACDRQAAVDIDVAAALGAQRRYLLEKVGAPNDRGGASRRPRPRP